MVHIGLYLKLRKLGDSYLFFKMLGFTKSYFFDVGLRAYLLMA